MNIQNAIELHEKKGLTFFNKEVMELFGSRVESELYKDKYFITSELRGSLRNERRYTIRKFDKDTGHVEIVGNGNEFGSFSEAELKMKKLK